MTWVTCKAVCSRRACRPVHSKCCPLHLHRRVYTRRACRHPRSVCTHHVRVQPISRSRRRHHWRQRDAPMHRTLRSCAERRRHHCPCSRQSPPCISRCLQRRATVAGCRRRRGTAPASPLWLRSQRRQSSEAIRSAGERLRVGRWTGGLTSPEHVERHSGDLVPRSLVASSFSRSPRRRRLCRRRRLHLGIKACHRFLHPVNLVLLGHEDALGEPQQHCFAR